MIGPVLGLLSVGLVGITSVRWQADGEHRPSWITIHATTWGCLFLGTAVLVTYAVAGVTSLLWAGSLETMLWFGMVLASTTGLGAVLILLGGAYHRFLQPRARET